MNVSIDWLKELVDLKVPLDELIRLIPLRTIGLKEVTQDFIELDMKGYNRADLLSMRGVANEIAAITDSKVKFTDPTEDEFVWKNQDLPKTPVSVEEENLSPIQVIAKIEGLKVEKSNPEWVKKLTDSGMRSVNNIADVTNLVMLEYGHPLHSFDARSVVDETVNVRRAKEGEEVLTLDGKTRKLITEDIVLADTEKALDVAGIMGSQETEIKDSTTSILLSASLFNPTMIRRTAQRLSFSSEASKRFYHGLTVKRLFQSLNAAIKMYQDLGGKLTAINIVGDFEDPIKKVKLTLKKINSLIGIDFKPEEIEESLTKLQFSLEKTEGGWKVTVPFFRLDINIEEDLIEEVARIYGYEKIPAKELVGDKPQPIDQSLFKLIYDLKDNLVKTGLTEVQTYSFYSTKVLEALGFNESNRKALIKIKNPMSSETEYMRMNIWPNLVEVIEKNMRQGYKDIAIFEIGKEYSFTPEHKIWEAHTLAIALMNGTDNPLAELNQIYEQSLKPTLGNNLEAKSDNPPAVISHLFHPSRFLSIDKGNERQGGMAEVHPQVLDKLGISKRVAILQIQLN